MHCPDANLFGRWCRSHAAAPTAGDFQVVEAPAWPPACRAGHRHGVRVLRTPAELCMRWAASTNHGIGRTRGTNMQTH